MRCLDFARHDIAVISTVAEKSHTNIYTKKHLLTLVRCLGFSTIDILHIHLFINILKNNSFYLFLDKKKQKSRLMIQSWENTTASPATDEKNSHLVYLERSRKAQTAFHLSSNATALIFKLFINRSIPIFTDFCHHNH